MIFVIRDTRTLLSRRFENSAWCTARRRIIVTPGTKRERKREEREREREKEKELTRVGRGEEFENRSARLQRAQRQLPC